MFKQDIGFYLGNEKADGFAGFVDENNFFLTLEIETGISPDNGRELTAFIREKIKGITIENLQQFDSLILSVIRQKNLPSGFSFSAGYLKGNIFYLKTINQGRIYIRRNNKIALLVEGDETASGYVEEDDIFIFTFNNFMKLIGDESGLNKKLDHRPTLEFIDEITSELIAKDNMGTAALFLKLKKIDEELKPVDNFFEKVKEKPSGFNLKDFYVRFGKQKTFTFIIVFILGVILFWSVGLGYMRRSQESNQKKINLTKDLIGQKLNQAEQVSFLNMSSALSLIADSREEIIKLKKEVPPNSSNYTEQIKELDKMILQSENKILKKEEKEYTEFFDLTVEGKNAKGDKLYLNKDQLLILDNNNGILFNLSLDKKSLDKNQSAEVKKSSLIGLFEGKEYFYVDGEGVYQIIDSKVKKVIENDKDWGKIVDLAVFNGNIYLLDQGKNSIYKYMVAESGFSSKNFYFQSGQSIDLSQISSLAIDGSIYLAGNSVMVKYTSGSRDGFKVNLPDGNINIKKIFTSIDLEKVYGWDKDKGTVYIMGKNGDYQEQINSKNLSQASDIVVYKNLIYTLQGSKIYKIE